MKKPNEMTNWEVFFEYVGWLIMALVALLLAAIPKK